MRVYTNPKSYELSLKVDGSHLVEVWADNEGRQLHPRHDLVTYSANGLRWGGYSPECQALALAILADAIKDDTLALVMHKRFALDVLSQYNARRAYSILRQEVINWLLNTLRDNFDSGTITFSPIPE